MMARWNSPSRDPFVDKWMFDAYTRADKVSVGQYIADFDVTHRMTRASLIQSSTFLKLITDVQNRS
jgi:hypothetical protein